MRLVADVRLFLTRQKFGKFLELGVTDSSQVVCLFDVPLHLVIVPSGTCRAFTVYLAVPPVYSSVPWSLTASVQFVVRCVDSHAVVFKSDFVRVSLCEARPTVSALNFLRHFPQRRVAVSCEVFQ